LENSQAKVFDHRARAWELRCGNYGDTCINPLIITHLFGGCCTCHSNSFGQRLAVNAVSMTASSIAYAATASALNGSSFGRNIIASQPSVLGNIAGSAIAGGIGTAFDGRAGSGSGSAGSAAGGTPDPLAPQQTVGNAQAEVQTAENTSSGGGSAGGDIIVNGSRGRYLDQPEFGISALNFKFGSGRGSGLYRGVYNDLPTTRSYNADYGLGKVRVDVIDTSNKTAADIDKIIQFQRDIAGNDKLTPEVQAIEIAKWDEVLDSLYSRRSISNSEVQLAVDYSDVAKAPDASNLIGAIDARDIYPSQGLPKIGTYNDGVQDFVSEAAMMAAGRVTVARNAPSAYDVQRGQQRSMAASIVTQRGSLGTTDSFAFYAAANGASPNRVQGIQNAGIIIDSLALRTQFGPRRAQPAPLPSSSYAITGPATAGRYRMTAIEVEALVRREGQASVNRNNDLIDRQIKAEILDLPTGRTREAAIGRRLDRLVRDDMIALRNRYGWDDSLVRINQRLYGPNGHTVPDIYFPQSQNVLDWSRGLKQPGSRQVRGWHSSITGNVEIARPDVLGGPYSIPRPRR
jgi:hypothetical protein